MELPFDEDDRPIPQIIVGYNGSGKTNTLSIIADALMQGASAAFNDILNQDVDGRNYFRVVGGNVVSYGQSHSLSIIRLTHAGQQITYYEQSGEITVDELSDSVPPNLTAGIKWGQKDSSKQINVSSDVAKEIYSGGVYSYFPASRSESPHWFNRDSIASDEFDLSPKYSGRLGRPIFVEHGIDEFSQWLLGVITEARLDVKEVGYEDDGKDKDNVRVTMNYQEYINTQAPLLWANQILQIILEDPLAKFAWAGRRNPRKVGVESGGRPVAIGLDSLSGGQATLLAAFGTILRYTDLAEMGPANVEGVVVIDELDAHMHIELQMRTLPRLIAMFPKVQFIISSHSPFFALGLEQTLTAAGVRVLELPSGRSINADAYVEFQKALDAFQKTQAFTETVREKVESGEKPIIYLAGETDLLYFKTAARVLNYHSMEGLFRWIGTDSGQGGGAYTGDPSLDKTVQMLRANTDLTSRKVIVVYDCDAKKTEEQFESIHVIKLQPVEGAKATKGIENMLPNHVLTDDMYEEKQEDMGTGRARTVPHLNKMKLARSLCGPDADAENFQNFDPTLKRIQDILSQREMGSTDTVSLIEDQSGAD